ncbi:MAG: tRNA uridine-5-carboxymethylaminomethyl(34) synthesis enzyme MnmG [Acidobacteriota bacterium]
MGFLDVIVIGAGHAGVEAASAAARLGVSVGLCTLGRDTVALMPCNPAVGGTAKGHLVREIDALGGVMGRAIDATGIQFKVLNRSRGPAVWSPRAQADKRSYGRWVLALLEAEPAIEWIEGRAGRVLVAGGRATGLSLEDGRVFRCATLVVTAGTFLNGVVHTGREQKPAGRADEPPSKDLAESLKALGFAWGRLKTGTPPRLSKASIDFDAAVGAGVFHVEQGDDDPEPFSFISESRPANRIVCHLLHTTEEVHQIVRDHIAESPLFNGQIHGIGPRYCPSLEDKVIRFPHRPRHQVYLEPEGLATDEVYVNGFSTCLPVNVQQRLVRSLPGLAEARILRPGYAVEYDFVQPTELNLGLETHRVSGLFLAGQLNGTSGYEEAAAQGLVAGINAARRAKGLSLTHFARDEAYIGILVDDLTTQGCLEPYRMFTSRAEHRLLLRVDNADLRLTPRGRDLGVVDDLRWERFERRRDRFARNLASLDRATIVGPGAASRAASEWLKRPEMRLETLMGAHALPLAIDPRDRVLDVISVETTVKYQGYLRRQQAMIDRGRKVERTRIPEGFPFERVPGLSRELVQRFCQVRPETLGQALRIPGATPAAVAVVGAYLRRWAMTPPDTAGLEA